MKLPRDISGTDLISALAKLGYSPTRQAGSHVRLSTSSGDHHITIPRHDPLKPGTLNGILKDVASHAGVEKAEIVRRLWG